MENVLAGMILLPRTTAKAMVLLSVPTGFMDLQAG